MDGHRFIADALERGVKALVCQALPWPLPDCPVIQVADSRAALSALADAFHGRPSQHLCMVGVTGTDGKTTTVELSRAVLSEAGYLTGSLGSVRYSLGGHSLDSVQTTPHPLALHAMLKQMAQSGVTHVCMEVSSHALTHQRTAHVAFDAAILTNVTEDHLDFHGSPEAYVRAKQRLFEQLPPDAFAILNAGSPVCERYRDATCANVLTYGMEGRADVTARRRSAGMRGINLLVRTPRESFPVRTSLIGEHNCENVLAAATLAFALELPPEAVCKALETFRGVPGRLERIDLPGVRGLPTLLVDYAHTPNALKRVLEHLRRVARRKLICVFGCGGNREKQKRPAMGRVATSLADLTIVTSDNSRDEPTEDIIAEILGGIEAPEDHYVTEPNRRRAIEMAIAEADSPRDVVVICGRGCERVQIIGELKIPFDDRIVAREVLRKLRGVRRKSA